MEHEARPTDGRPETALNCEAMIPKAKATAGEPIRTPVHLWRGVSETAIQTLLRLTFEQLALLPGVPLTPLLEAAVPDLVLDLREPIFERKVVLQGRGGSIGYLYAESLNVPGTIPLHVSTRLLQVEEPIDTILQELRLPTFRKVIAYRRACLGEIADRTVAASFGTDGSADVLSRTSLLYVHQRPQCATMRITEMLPVAYLYEQQDASICKPPWAATPS